MTKNRRLQKEMTALAALPAGYFDSAEAAQDAFAKCVKAAEERMRDQQRAEAAAAWAAREDHFMNWTI